VGEEEGIGGFSGGETELRGEEREGGREGGLGGEEHKMHWEGERRSLWARRRGSAASAGEKRSYRGKEGGKEGGRERG
jgi:hypothetical protein